MPEGGAAWVRPPICSADTFFRLTLMGALWGFTKRRTIWAYAEESLREYSSTTGKILREMSSGYLASLGVASPVTTMSWVTTNQLLLGMKTGNRVVLLNTAPQSARDEALDLYRQRQGIPPGSPLPEPPGQATEDDLIREVNKAEVEGTLTIAGSSLVSPNSLGSISYDSVQGSVLFTTTRTDGTVFEAKLSSKGSLAPSKFHRSTGRSSTSHSGLCMWTQDLHLHQLTAMPARLCHPASIIPGTVCRTGVCVKATDRCMLCSP